MNAQVMKLDDSLTMFRRILLRMRRYPSLTLMLVGMPVVMMALFVYVFGGTMGAGIVDVASGTGGRDAYLEYLMPGMLIFALAAIAQGIAISIAMDVSSGLIGRLLTMAVYQPSILVGHFLGALLQCLLAAVVTFAAAFAMGYRPDASVSNWVFVVLYIILAAVPLIWLSMALGLAADTVETASNVPMILILLPFMSSGFVPTESMPSWMRWFTEYQPFTSIIETIRSQLDGENLNADAWQALVWCVVGTLLSYLWTSKLYQKRTGTS